MNYSQLLQRLYTTNKHGGMKLGLDNMIRLNQALKSPDKTFSSIHVAGTNGKGSVVTKIAKGLESHYPRVGLYTSPHISSFRERIRINNVMISEQDIVIHLTEILSLADKVQISATFFEITTLLALKYFADHSVDIAVIETGLGGRLDATNIISPLMTVITSIGFDHTEILGKSLEKIAHEKAGIIKPGIPVVLGPTALHVPIPKENPRILVPAGATDFEIENRSIARAALENLNIPEKTIRKALTTKLPCRLESTYHNNQQIILDVAHNPDALAKLFQSPSIPSKNLRVIFGLGKNKDISGCLEIIRRHAHHLHLVDAPNGRCSSPKQMQQVLLGQGVSPEDISMHSTIKESVSHALDQAHQQNQNLLICGSFFIMGEARKALGIEEPNDPIDMNER